MSRFIWTKRFGFERDLLEEYKCIAICIVHKGVFNFSLYKVLEEENYASITLFFRIFMNGVMPFERFMLVFYPLIFKLRFLINSRGHPVSLLADSPKIQ